MIVVFGCEYGEWFDVWIEVDVDGYCLGILFEVDLLIDVGCVLIGGGMWFGGVFVYVGFSYEYDMFDVLVVIVE